MHTKKIGKIAEDIAVRFLKKKDFRIIERNFTCKLGEIDIVATDENFFVFIEVRSAQGYRFHNPLESITRRKTDKLTQLATVWLDTHNIADANARFDILAVVFIENSKMVDITHIVDAF
ncbi:YraN family protein [Candidatus Omnitrophota bacterium]